MADDVTALQADVKKYKTMAKKLKAKAEAAEARVAELEASAAGPVVGEEGGASAEVAALKASLAKEQNMVTKLKTKLRAEMKKTAAASPDAGGSGGSGGSGGGGGDKDLVRKLKLKCKSLMQKLEVANRLAAGSGSGGSGSGESAEVAALNKELDKRTTNHKTIKERLRKEMAEYKAAGDAATDEDKKKLAKAKALYRKSEALIKDLTARRDAAAAAAAEGPTAPGSPDPNADDSASVVSVASAASTDSNADGKYKKLAAKYKGMVKDLQVKLKAATKAVKASSGGGGDAGASSGAVVVEVADPGTGPEALASIPSDELAAIVVSLRKQLADRNGRVQRLMDDVARLSSLDSDLEAINLDRDIALAQADNYKLEVDALRLELEDMRMDMELYQAREAEFSLAFLEEASAENLAVQKLFYKSMEKQNKKLRDALVQVREVAASDRNEFKRQLDELVAVSEQYPAAQARIMELEDTIAEMEDTVEHLKDQLDATGDAAVALEDMAEEKLLAEEKTAQLELHVDELNHLVSVSEATIEAYVEEHVRLLEAADAADARADTLLDELESSHDRLNDAHETITQFRALVADLQSQVESAADGGPSSGASAKLSALMASSASLSSDESALTSGIAASAAKRASAAFRASVADYRVAAARDRAALLEACLPGSFRGSVLVGTGPDAAAIAVADAVTMAGVISRMRGGLALALSHIDSSYNWGASTRAGAVVSLADLASVARATRVLRTLYELVDLLAVGFASGTPAVVAKLASKVEDLAPMEGPVEAALDALGDDELTASYNLTPLNNAVDRVRVLLSYTTAAAASNDDGGVDGEAVGPSESAEPSDSVGSVATAAEYIGRAPKSVPLSRAIAGLFRNMRASAVTTLMEVRALNAALCTSVVPPEADVAAARASLGESARQDAVVRAALASSAAPTAALLASIDMLLEETRSMERQTVKVMKGLGAGGIVLSNQAWAQLDTATGLLDWIPSAAAAFVGAVKDGLLSEAPDDTAGLADVVASAYTSVMAREEIAGRVATVPGYACVTGEDDVAGSLSGLVDAVCTASGAVKALVDGFLGGEFDDTSDAALAKETGGLSEPVFALAVGETTGGAWARVTTAYTAAVAEAEALGPALAAATADRDRLLRSAKGREQALQEAKVQADVLGKRIEVLQERIDAVDELESQVRTLKTSEASFREAIAALRKENDELKAKPAISPLTAFTRNVQASTESSGTGSSGVPGSGSSGGAGASGASSGPSGKEKGKSILAALTGGKSPVLARANARGRSGSGASSADVEPYVRAIKYLRGQVQELRARVAGQTMQTLTPLRYGSVDGAGVSPGAAAMAARHGLLLADNPKRTGGRAVAKRSAAAKALKKTFAETESRLAALVRESRDALAGPHVVDVSGGAGNSGAAQWLASRSYLERLRAQASELQGKVRGVLGAGLVGGGPGLAFGEFASPQLNRALDEGHEGELVGKVTIGGSDSVAVDGGRVVLNDAQWRELVGSLAVA